MISYAFRVQRYVIILKLMIISVWAVVVAGMGGYMKHVWCCSLLRDCD